MRLDDIPDELVARAVIARGHAPDQGGIGAAMRAALAAVADDLAHLAAQPARLSHQPDQRTR